MSLLSVGNVVQTTAPILSTVTNQTIPLGSDVQVMSLDNGVATVMYQDPGSGQSYTAQANMSSLAAPETPAPPPSYSTSLHPDILDLVQFQPIEDLLLALLRPKLTNVPVQTLVWDDQTFPFVLVRANGDWGPWSGDTRFIDSGQVNIQVYCDGLNSDQDAALLSEAVRRVLTDSINVVVPGIGHLTRVEQKVRARRAADWATATGPVQYADLPTTVIRYETVYDISFRRAL